MRILHTSDWHLGHRLLDQSQLEEQTLFLDWLLNYIASNRVDVLLVSGDIFDVGVPAANAQKLYYDFLVRLHQSCCREVIITGGNHDAPSTLNAPKELLNALSIHVVGKAVDPISDEIFRLSVDDEELIVAAIPYLRDQDIRRAIAAESGEEIVNRYKTALMNHFEGAAEFCYDMKAPDTTVIAMGHLFVVGGRTSESEQSIYVGNLGDIGADDFPLLFDYVALGHLHRAQRVGGKEHIRYPGSPYILSFSEAGQEKKIVQIETGKTPEISEITVPEFRKIVQVTGSVENYKTQLINLHRENHTLTPWVEVILSQAQDAVSGYQEIHSFAREISPEVLKVTVRDEQKYENLKSIVEQARNIKSFTPMDVFKLKCEEMNVNLIEKPEMLDAFNEILQVVTENN